MAHISTNKWDFRFMELAELVATWSKDPSTRVGAVVTQGKEVLSLGYNGFPSCLEDDLSLLIDRDEKYPRTVHAEVNAIMRLKNERPDVPLHMYVTHMPCSKGCVPIILGRGIKKVFTRRPPPEFADRWDTGKSAIILQEGAELIYV